MSHKTGRISWRKRGVREWEGDTGGYGRLLIQAAKVNEPNSNFRFYLMTAPFMGDPTVMSNHTSLDNAKQAAEEYVGRLVRHKEDYDKRNSFWDYKP